MLNGRYISSISKETAKPCLNLLEEVSPEHSIPLSASQKGCFRRKKSLWKRDVRLTRLSILTAVVPLTATICQTLPFAAAIAVCRPANAPVVRLI